MGIEQARRDDIESIGYVIMYLLRGILPWQNMKAKDTKTKYKMIMDKKISTPAEILCKNYPQEMTTFINYARNLKFEEKPDYAYIKNLIKSALKSNGSEFDYVYDWNKKGTTAVKSEKKVVAEEPIYTEKVRQEENPVPKKEDIKASLPAKNTTYNPRNKLSAGGTNKPTLNTSSNLKSSTGGKPTLEAVMGQKLNGPKISTIRK